MAVKTAVKPMDASPKLCACGKRIAGRLDVCETCMTARRNECAFNANDPNFKPRNPNCNYGWHGNVMSCSICMTLGIYGTTGCKPCEKCHYCNEVHPMAAAA